MSSIVGRMGYLVYFVDWLFQNKILVAVCGIKLVRSLKDNYVITA